MTVVQVSLADAVAEVEAGIITDAKTIIGLLLTGRTPRLLGDADGALALPLPPRSSSRGWRWSGAARPTPSPPTGATSAPTPRGWRRRRRTLDDGHRARRRALRGPPARRAAGRPPSVARALGGGAHVPPVPGRRGRAPTAIRPPTWPRPACPPACPSRSPRTRSTPLLDAVVGARPGAPARPGHPRAALRHGHAHLRAVRAVARRPRPRRRAWCGCSARAPRSASCRSGRPARAALADWLEPVGRPRVGAGPVGPRATTPRRVPEPARRPAVPPGGVGDRAGLRRPGRPRRPAVSPTSCATRAPPTCSTTAPTSAWCRSCSATRRSRRRRCTRRCRPSGCGRCTTRPTPGPGARRRGADQFHSDTWRGGSSAPCRRARRRPTTRPGPPTTCWPASRRSGRRWPTADRRHAVERGPPARGRPRTGRRHGRLVRGGVPRAAARLRRSQRPGWRTIGRGGGDARRAGPGGAGRRTGGTATRHEPIGAALPLPPAATPSPWRWSAPARTPWRRGRARPRTSTTRLGRRRSTRFLEQSAARSTAATAPPRDLRSRRRRLGADRSPTIGLRRRSAGREQAERVLGPRPASSRPPRRALPAPTARRRDTSPGSALSSA